jgi:hypothetical protein
MRARHGRRKCRARSHPNGSNRGSSSSADRFLRAKAVTLRLQHFNQNQLDDKTEQPEGKREKQHKHAELAGLGFAPEIPNDKDHEQYQAAEADDQRPLFELFDGHEDIPEMGAQFNTDIIMRRGLLRQSSDAQMSRNAILKHYLLRSFVLVYEERESRYTILVHSLPS